MKREWKPGDVAMVKPLGMAPYTMLRTRGGKWLCLHATIWRDEQVEWARPLVVIDPEDREQVEMLRDLWDGAHTEQQGHAPSQSARGARGNALQAALREFANPTPPKPAEPTGLGAVVEAADGVRWVRSRRDAHQWRHDYEDGSAPYHAWSDIAAVRVLSEGVTQ